MTAFLYQRSSMDMADPSPGANPLPESRRSVAAVQAEHDDGRLQFGSGIGGGLLEHPEAGPAGIDVVAAVRGGDDHAPEDIWGNAALPHRLGRPDDQLPALLVRADDSQHVLAG